MIYLSSFKLSNKKLKNPNIYPYSVFKDKYIEPFSFAPITIFYGNNGCGKSTLLNIIAGKLKIKGKESPASNNYGSENYCQRFENECAYSLGSNEYGVPFYHLPENSRYIKSEDILYEIKKIQQKAILEHGLTYDYMQEWLSLEKAQSVLNKKKEQRIENIIFSQEKYSNGETSLQFFQEYLIPEALYLLDEPEVSLSPANQVALAHEINKLAHYLGCQFVIATHSPFMLGTLDAKIYNLDAKECQVTPWYQLENVRYFYDFFKKHEKEFTQWALFFFTLLTNH